jgi:hypothetical protein
MRYHEVGWEKALQEYPRSGAPSKIDGRVEATLTMLACSDPPGGLWTMDATISSRQAGGFTGRRFDFSSYRQQCTKKMTSSLGY